MAVERSDPAALDLSLAHWASVEPDAVAAWLAGVSVPWWIAGGWALDLFLGRQMRPHQDLDVGVLRRDAAQVLPALAGWEVFEAVDGSLARLGADSIPRAAANCLWCRRTSSGPWLMELMLDDADDEYWVYRRERRIRRKLSEVVRLGARGIPYLAPEVQLLYKSKAVRPKDELDFRNVVPRLSIEARQWFEQSLARTSPAHDWLGQIALGATAEL